MRDRVKVGVVLMAVAVAGGVVVPSAGALGKPGDLDPTFSGGGAVTLSLARANPLSTFLQSITADPAGRILVAGGASDVNGKQAGVVARLTPNGTPDPSFGAGGSVVMQTGEGTGAGRPYSFANSVFTTPTGRVGAASYRVRAGDRLDQSAFELLDNGQPDIDFGSGGLATRDPATAPAYANTSAAAVGPDGSVYVSGILEGTPTSGANRKLALTKFTAAGQVALGFGNQAGTWVGGFSLSPTDTGTYGGPMIVTPDNKILMAGTALWTDGRQAVLLARFSAQNGQPDATFGTKPGNTVVQARDAGAIGGDSQGSGLALGPLGAIYVAGSADDAQDRFAMALTRYTPSGEPDYTFGNGGVKRFQTATGSDPDRGSSGAAVVIQPDGKALLVGTNRITSGESEGVILRVRTDGTLDPTFGSGGVVRLQLAKAGGTQRATRLTGATIVGGRLVVTGGVSDTATTGLVARILLDPLPDPPAPGPGGSTPAPPPNAGPPSPTAKPIGAVTLRASRLTVDATGRVRVALACSKAGPCTGRLQLVAATGKIATASAKRRRAATYATTVPYNIAAGRSRTIVLKLKVAAKSRLRGHRSLKARLVLTPTGAKPKTRAVTLLAPRRR